jgi:hypothetical protein
MLSSIWAWVFRVVSSFLALKSKLRTHFSFPHECNTLCPLHFSWSVHLSGRDYKSQSSTLLRITQSSPHSCHFVPFRSIHSKFKYVLHCMNASDKKSKAKWRTLHSEGFQPIWNRHPYKAAYPIISSSWYVPLPVYGSITECNVTKKLVLCPDTSCDKSFMHVGTTLTVLITHCSAVAH